MIDGYIALHARLRPSWPAVILPNAQISFAKFDEDIDRAAWELEEIEVEADEAVSVAIRHPYLHWIAIMALARRGIASAPSNATTCRLRIGDETTVGSSPALTWDTARIDRILRAAPCKWHIEPRNRTSVGRMVLTSGTTGTAKGLVATWMQLDYYSLLQGSLGTEGPWYAATGVASAMGYSVLLACWRGGNPAIMGAHGLFNGDFLTRLRPRVIALVPDQLSKVIDNLAPDFRQAPVRLLVGGGSIPPALARRTRLHLTADIRCAYGTTESGIVAIAELPQLEAGRNVAGYVMPGVQVELVDESGKPVPAGDLGRLRICGPDTDGSYVGDPETSAAAFKDGWFETQDLGRLDLDGLLTIEGRADEMMNIAGHKVLPGWVEDAALGCPGVVEVGAVSLPDAVELERCVLAIVVGPDFVEAALLQALRKQLQWLKAISWFAVDHIPRNQMGKIDRPQLRRLAATLRSGAPALAEPSAGAQDIDVPLELLASDIFAER